MLGRWQPWHDGHRALFEKILSVAGQVCIGVRDTHGTTEKDPLPIEDVISRIHEDLEKDYAGKYTVWQLPNISGVYYGRDVGYKIEQETFDSSVTDISATKIRKDLGIE